MESTQEVLRLFRMAVTYEVLSDSNPALSFYHHLGSITPEQRNNVLLRLFVGLDVLDPRADFGSISSSSNEEPMSIAEDFEASSPAVVSGLSQLITRMQKKL